MHLEKLVIIPCFNPPLKVVEYVQKLLSNGIDKILIVNDGSGEEYSPTFDNLKNIDKVTVLTHNVNLGKGRALKTALRYIRDEIKVPLVIATCDCDGQHLVEDVVNCLKYAEKNLYYFVLGVRNFNDKVVPFRSRFGNKATSKFFKKLYGVYLKDTQTGLRAFSTEFLNTLIYTKGNRFEYEMNVLVNLVKKKHRIMEVPIATVYNGKDNETHSHFSTVKDSVKVWGVLIRRAKWKFIFNILTCLLIIAVIVFGIVYLI